MMRTIFYVGNPLRGRCCAAGRSGSGGFRKAGHFTDWTVVYKPAVEC